jgi:hypothetical protein
MRKLDAHSVVDSVRYALRNNLTPRSWRRCAAVLSAGPNAGGRVPQFQNRNVAPMIGPLSSTS